VSVEIKDKMPASISGLVLEHIEARLYLVPSWCHKLYARYDAELKDVATILGKPEYREALLTFGPRIVDGLNGNELDLVIVHELLHLHQEMARDVFYEALEFIPEGPFRETFRNRYDYANEGAVCDLTRAVA
tara:strand:- start:3715 stop:4110 length:396 start_codon:yes stop_codon:yes gene_type:complete